MNFKLLFLFLFSNLFICNAQIVPLYVGTYTDSVSKGIYQVQFNTKTGALSNLQLAAKTENPSYIAYSPDKKYVYAVGESGSGSVSSFKVEDNGALTFLNQVESQGEAPCYIAIKNTGDKAVVANYLGGNVSLYDISEDGSLQDAYEIFNYNVPNKISHAHSAQFFNDKLFVSDLGMDAVYEYQLNNDGKNYDLINPSIVKFSEKSGPRHFSITKKGDYIYVINEYASTITAIKKVKDQFELIANYSTLDANYKGENACADIHLSKDDRFLYGSNRGENTIVVFKRNLTDGTLEKIQNINVHGDWPRNFTLDPTGKFLLVANKKSNNISVFKVDSNSGTLSFLNSMEAPTPVCLLF